MTDDRFRRDLVELINKYNVENSSDTPDSILADYLVSCLINFAVATRRRDAWYGVKLEPGKTYALQEDSIIAVVPYDNDKSELENGRDLIDAYKNAEVPNG